MRKTPRIPAMTLLAGALLCLHAGAADLAQIYQQALGSDPLYTGARYTLAAGAEKVTQGRAGLLPAAAITGAYARSGDTMNNSANSYALQLSQPLLRAANWETYQQGKLLAAQSEAQFALAQQDLILRVSQAYFDILAAQDALAFLRAQEVAISEQLASAKRTFEVGTTTITDTNEAQARYDLAVAQEIGANNDLEVARSRLQQITGQLPPPLAILRKDVGLSQPEPAQMDPWIGSAERQNYTILSQQLALEIAQRQIKINRAGHYPTVDLVATRSRNTLNNVTGSPSTIAQSGTSNTNSIGVQWSIPLFSGFYVDSKVSEAIALEDRSRSDLEYARRTAILNARQAYLGVSNGLAQVKALEAAEISSLSALDSNKLGYEVGVRINIDVLNAQQQLFATRRDLSKARYDTLMNGLKLKAAAGALQEQDLVQLNRLLTAPSS